MLSDPLGSATHSRRLRDLDSKYFALQFHCCTLANAEDEAAAIQAWALKHGDADEWDAAVKAARADYDGVLKRARELAVETHDAR